VHDPHVVDVPLRLAQADLINGAQSGFICGPLLKWWGGRKGLTLQFSAVLWRTLRRIKLCPKPRSCGLRLSFRGLLASTVVLH
jgi:hypothetical protein